MTPPKSVHVISRALARSSRLVGNQPEPQSPSDDARHPSWETNSSALELPRALPSGRHSNKRKIGWIARGGSVRQAAIKGLMDCLEKNWPDAELLRLEPSLVKGKEGELRAFEGILISGDSEILKLLELTDGIPRVVTNHGPGNPPIPCPLVTEDEEAKAELAIDFLERREVVSYAYVNWKGGVLPARRDAMMSAMAATGKPTRLVEASPHLDGSDAALARNLSDLPRPAGVVAFSGRLALPAKYSAAALGWHIPRDIRLLACGESELSQELFTHGISTIDPDAELIGWRAGELLLKEIEMPGSVCEEEILVKPKGIRERASTDIWSERGGPLARALQYMRDHLDSEQMSVNQIAKGSGISSKGLQDLFRRQLGRSVWEEWRAMRLEKALELIDRTKHSMAEVAATCGFSDSAHFCREFRRRYGETPTARRIAKRQSPDA